MGELMWRDYYWRVIGMFLTGGGIFLMLDEIIQGTFKFQLIGHETAGLACIILGAYFISKKPKGK